MPGESFREDPRRVQARRLYVEPGLSRAELMRRFRVGDGTLREWLEGVDPPEWTRRPRAKDDLRARAAEMRRQARSVPEIARELGVSKSTVYLWTREISPAATPEAMAKWRSRRAKEAADARWAPVNRVRDERRAEVNAAARASVGALGARELLLLGAMAYWCEGAKAKPWEPHRCRVTFINSDPALILTFLRFLELVGEDRRRLNYRLQIHESADVDAAGRWWADVVGVPWERFSRPTLKTHNPSTIRHNVGDPYRGCLIVRVPKSRELYWRLEGLFAGIADVETIAGDGKM